MAAFLTILIACQKDEVTNLPEDDNQNVFLNSIKESLNEIAMSVENNRLVFESEKDFQKCIDFLAELGDNNFPAFEKTIGFSSYRNSFENDPIKSNLFPDELFQTLLNPKMEIIIGNYLFREVPSEEKTLAFVLSDKELCSEKSAKLQKADYEFSCYEDAFEILNGENILKGGPRCRSNNDEKNKEWEFQSENYSTPLPNTGGGYKVALKAKLCYQYSAVFKSIIAKFKTSTYETNGIVTEMVEIKLSITGNYKYDRKNESPRSGYINESTTVYQNQAGPSWRPFHSTRRVRCYDVSTNFKYEFVANTLSPQFVGLTNNGSEHIECNAHISDCQ